MRIIEILKILQKYNIDENYPLWAGHEVICFNVGYEDISKEDLERLEKLGVFYDDDYDSLAIYV